MKKKTIMDMKRKTFLLVFLSLFFAENSFANDGGTCGDNLKWYFDEDEQTLTISGCGYMKDYYPVSNPWDNYRDLIQYVNIRNGVLSIGGHAFADCKNLTNINLPNSVSVIEDFAFSGCNNLNSVTFPSSLREIRYSAFLNCSGLKTINFSEGLRLIAYASFAGCYSLNGITLPSSLEYLGSYAFEGCYKVSDLYCYAVNPPKIIGMQIEDIFVYSPFDSEMKWATLHVPESSINTYRTSGSWGNFRYYEPLSEYDPRPGITIPSSTKCGNNLFWNYSIETNTVTLTGDGAMWDYDTNNLSPWTDYKEEMERIVLGDKITHIGNYAFYFCKNIKSIDSKINNPDDIEDTAFGDETYQNAELYVPKSSVSLYQSKFGWSNFANIIDSGNEYEQPDDPQVNMTLIAEKDWTNCTLDDLISAGGGGETPGLNVISAEEGLGIVFPSYPFVFFIEGVSLSKGHSYLVKITAKIPSSGQLYMLLGNLLYFPNNMESLPEVYFNVEKSSNVDVIEVKFPNAPVDCDGDATLLLFADRCKMEGTVVIQKVQIYDVVITDIKTCNNDTESFDVYSVNGYKIRSRVNTIEDLPKGLYIINGKKIVK